MKRILWAVLAVCVCLCGCGAEPAPSSSTEKTTTADASVITGTTSTSRADESVQTETTVITTAESTVSTTAETTLQVQTTGSTVEMSAATTTVKTTVKTTSVSKSTKKTTVKATGKTTTKSTTATTKHTHIKTTTSSTSHTGGNPLNPDTVPMHQERDQELEMLRIINEERQKVGRAPLAENTDIYVCAHIRMCEIQTLFAHQRPDGSQFFTVFDECNKDFGYTTGENICMGAPDAKEAMDAFMNSPGHRENILREEYTAVAVACLDGYWVQLFTG